VRVLRRVGIGLGLLLLLAGGVAVVARFSDGPLAMFPGGELTSGDWVAASPDDVETLRETGEIELQLLDPARSRTTWVLVHDGAIFVPCGAPTIRLLKQWPHHAMRDGRAVIRFDGKRQRRTALRVHDRDTRAALLRELARKYPGGEGDVADEDAVWFFRLDPRNESGSTPAPGLRTKVGWG